jgi:hypothetical protein
MVIKNDEIDNKCGMNELYENEYNTSVKNDQHRDGIKLLKRVLKEQVTREC